MFSNEIDGFHASIPRVVVTPYGSAREAPEFDAILGGHDHHYVAKTVEPHGIPVIKSGTEFRWATKTFFELSGVPGERPKVSWETIEVTKEYPEHPEAKKLADELDAKLGAWSSTTSHFDFHRFRPPFDSSILSSRAPPMSD